MLTAEDGSGFLRTSARLSVITGAARLAGFARYIVLGVAVGTTYLGNTYETANWVPNIVFELVAGGMLSAVFVPTFVRELEHGRERGNEIASALANTFLLLSVPVVILGAVAARPIMQLLTVAVDDPVVRAQQIEMGSWFLYVFLPQIPIYVFAMVTTGVLHAHRRFFAPAAAPLFSSLVVISAYLTFGALGAGADLGTVTSTQRYVLAGGTTAGVFVLAFSQLPSLLRTGVRWHPVLRWSDPAVRRALRAGLAGMAYFAITEIGLIVTLLLANRVEGGVVAYRVAFAFFDLPRALVGIPLAAVLLPRAHRARCAVGNRRLRRPLVEGLACGDALRCAGGGRHGGAGSRARRCIAVARTVGSVTDLVASMLRVLAIGIPAFVLVEPLIRSFFARHETLPPVVMNAVTVGVCVAIVVPMTVVLSPEGPQALAVIGIGLAAGHWLGAAVGAIALSRRVREWRVREDVGAALGNVMRAAVMGAIVFGLVGWLNLVPEVEVVVGVAAGLGVYALLAARGGELWRTMRWLRTPSA